MNKTFEEWLKTVWREDENRVIRRRQIGELREELKAKIIEVFEGNVTGMSGCMCDSCVASIIKSDTSLQYGLMSIALEYLLGENFNGASARYYYDYVRQSKNED